MKVKEILKLINKKGIVMMTAYVIALTTLGAGTIPAYAVEDKEVVQEDIQQSSADNFFQSEAGYSIKSINTDDVAVKVYDYNLSKKLSDNSSIVLKGNKLAKYDTAGNLLWEKTLASKIGSSKPAYNNLLVDSKDNIIVLGYYSGVTNGIYAVYDVDGNRTDYKYGSYVPVTKYQDSVTFDTDENLIFQSDSDPYKVYDRSRHRYFDGKLKETNYGDVKNYHCTKVVSTNDGGRMIIGYSFKDNWIPLLIKIDSQNKVVFNHFYYEQGFYTSSGNDKGFYSSTYKTADGGLIVRNKKNGNYYKVDSSTGNTTKIETYGTILGFKTVNGIDYMYGKIGKETLGDMASNINSSTINYVIPVRKDFSEGAYFDFNFGTIKDLTSDMNGNLEVVFSGYNKDFLNISKETSKVISVTLAK